MKNNDAGLYVAVAPAIMVLLDLGFKIEITAEGVLMTDSTGFALTTRHPPHSPQYLAHQIVQGARELLTTSLQAQLEVERRIVSAMQPRGDA